MPSRSIRNLVNGFHADTSMWLTICTLFLLLMSFHALAGSPVRVRRSASMLSSTIQDGIFHVVCFGGMNRSFKQQMQIALFLMMPFVMLL